MREDAGLPVDSVKRVRHFRQHPKFRKEAERNPATTSEVQREGRVLEAQQVIDAIVHYLETDAKQDLHVEASSSGDQTY